jgi:DNA-directed RNA polymerase subunit RPC12/RpoP
MDADNEADEEYRCDVCGETFESDAALRDHVYSVGLVH